MYSTVHCSLTYSVRHCGFHFNLPFNSGWARLTLRLSLTQHEQQWRWPTHLQDANWKSTDGIKVDLRNANLKWYNANRLSVSLTINWFLTVSLAYKNWRTVDWAGLIAIDSLCRPRYTVQFSSRQYGYNFISRSKWYRFYESGKGLGKGEDGISEAVKVDIKQDTTGVSDQLI